jgi:predicted TPR repeat methyltransferase
MLILKKTHHINAREKAQMGDPFQRAKAIHNDGRLDEAVDAYEEVLRSDPENFKAHNNLGTVYEEKQDYAAAVDSYRRALEINPDAAPVHYNLAHALQRQGQLEAAVRAYEEALVIRPDDPDTLYNLGHAYHDLGDFDAAETAYRKAIAGDSDHYRAHSNLGSLLFDQSRESEAEKHYRRVIAIKADSAPDHFNLGCVLEVRGKLAEALEAFRTSLNYNPLSAIAYEHAARLEEQINGPVRAIELLDRWLAFMPNDPVALHMHAAFVGDQTTSRASDDYLRTTFDAFASAFDKRLEKLKYKAPQIIGRCVESLYAGTGDGLDILDLGCGTGLCAPYVRPQARYLTGVDISSAMLDKARERGGYDELVEAELTTFLCAKKCDYDLIIAADVLIYFGDLLPVLQAAEIALRPDGNIAFTVEHYEESDAPSGYFLNPHGRYSHTDAYVQQSLQQAGFVLLELSPVTLRTESGQPVKGLLVVAKATDDTP